MKSCMNYIINLLKNKNSDLTISRRFNLKHITMNENIDLTKILKDCPNGWKFYSDKYGEVTFWGFSDLVYPIQLNTKNNGAKLLSEKGEEIIGNGKCILFPSKDQKDWNKFTAPWYKNEKFDPKTLNPFDRVLVRDEVDSNWRCDLFSYIAKCMYYPYRCVGGSYIYCIPYNDDTKYLVGTKEEAPEYYRYWED